MLGSSLLFKDKFPYMVRSGKNGFLGKVPIEKKCQELHQMKIMVYVALGRRKEASFAQDAKNNRRTGLQTNPMARLNA